jgi:hypothetical protein
MSGRALQYLADFTALMATRKYGKVSFGHPLGSQSGVDFRGWVLTPMVIGILCCAPPKMKIESG